MKKSFTLVSMFFALISSCFLSSNSHAQEANSPDSNQNSTCKLISDRHLVPMMSHCSTVFARVQIKTIDANIYRYYFYIIDISTKAEQSFYVDSEIVYSSGFCTDNFIVLTSNNTPCTPTVLLHCIGQLHVLENSALFSFPKYNITTYTAIKNNHTGHTEEDICWHSNQWLFDNDTVVLRLGNQIPNRCSVTWSYSRINNSFSIEDTGKLKKQFPSSTKIIKINYCKNNSK